MSSRGSAPRSTLTFASLPAAANGALEVADAVHRRAVDVHDEIAAREVGPVGGAVRLDAQDQHAVLVGESDGAAHARGHCRRSHGDAQARCQALIRLEERQPGRNVLGERGPGVGRERGHQPLGSIAVRRQRLLDELQPALREGHRDAATVLGIAATRDDPGVLEPSEPYAHRPRGAPDTGDELALVERVAVCSLERG